MDVVVNKLGDPIQAQIAAALVAPKDVSFHFRKDRELEEKNPATKGKTKRPTFKLALPQLTAAGLIAALQAGDKSTELALDQANEAIVNRMRGLIADKIENDSFDPASGKWGITLDASMFNLDDLSFLKIAQLPKSERGSGISKEAWAAFVTDYKETMASPAAIEMFSDKKPRPAEILEKHGVILGGKFNPVRSRKDIIQQMLGFLDIWVQVSTSADEHQECYDFLRAKGEALMKAEEFNDL